MPEIEFVINSIPLEGIATELEAEKVISFSRKKVVKIGTMLYASVGREPKYKGALKLTRAEELPVLLSVGVFLIFFLASMVLTDLFLLPLVFGLVVSGETSTLVLAPM